jgi:hypothetical protein
VLLLASLALGCNKPTARTSEPLFVENTVLPIISDFARRHNLLTLTNLTTNRITWSKFSDHKSRKFWSGNLRIDGSHRFWLFQEGDFTPVVGSYEKLPQAWIVYSDSFPPEKQRVFEATPNKLSTNQALAIVRRHFLEQGHVETNFHPVVFHQTAIIPESSSELIRLPFFEAKWFRRDVNVDNYLDGQVLQPFVGIVISGYSSELLKYLRGHLPGEGGDWGTNSPQPAHPISTENFFQRPSKVW